MSTASTRHLHDVDEMRKHRHHQNSELCARQSFARVRLTLWDVRAGSEPISGLAIFCNFLLDDDGVVSPDSSLSPDQILLPGRRNLNIAVGAHLTKLGTLICEGTRGTFPAGVA